MDTSETLAFHYLTSLHLGDVVYEPDGNVPPDFLVNGRIAVEVRRLNQNSEGRLGRPQGLEELVIPLRHKIQKCLREYGPSQDGECWYVGYGFRRPLDSWKVLRPLIDEALTEFKRSPERIRKKIKLTKRFNIDFFPAGVDHGSFYILGVHMDEDSGGWVMSELDRNLRICIAQKEAKVLPYRQKYPIWWLVLDDHIDYAVDYEDRERFKAEVTQRIRHSFDKIVLLDPRGKRRAFEF